MTRVAAAAAFGALAGSLSAFSHAMAGGMLSPLHLAVISLVSAGVFALGHRWMRKPVVLVAALLGLQLGAHMWLEAVHPHAHVAAAGGASHSHGVSGAIAHALTPGMIMMWAHFAAVIAAVTLLGLMRPLLHALAYVVAQLHAIRLVPIVSQYPLRPVCIGLPTLSLRGLTRTTPRRGPPIFA